MPFFGIPKEVQKYVFPEQLIFQIWNNINSVNFVLKKYFIARKCFWKIQFIRIQCLKYKLKWYGKIWKFGKMTSKPYYFYMIIPLKITLIDSNWTIVRPLILFLRINVLILNVYAHRHRTVINICNKYETSVSMHFENGSLKKFDYTNYAYYDTYMILTYYHTIN